MQLGYAGGDPHFQTLDKLEYTFNGLGKFIFSQALDMSYRIQVNTDVLSNVNQSSDSASSSSLSGTVFTSFAMQATQSPVFQVSIGAQSSPQPFLNLFVDGVSVNGFAQNTAFLMDYPCATGDTGTL